MFRRQFSTRLSTGIFSGANSMTCTMRLMAQTRHSGRVEMKFSAPSCQATFVSQQPIKTTQMFRRVPQAAPAAASQVGFGLMGLRSFHTSSVRHFNRRSDAIEQTKQVQHRVPDEEKGDEEEEEEEDKGASQGYLPFPAPFHTVNIISLLFVANLLIYTLMNWVLDDDWREFVVDNFTCSHENWMRVYPLLISSFYQEHLLQLVIDCWLLWQFGNTVLDFLGAGRLFTFWAMCSVGGSLIHVARQQFELYYGMDPLEVRGRCFGPNPFILGLVAVEGLIFRHLNFMQSPPVPFLVLTAFVMVIDVWRVFTTKPEEHGASTGGALVAYLFWLMPTRFYGLDRLTAAM